MKCFLRHRLMVKPRGRRPRQIPPWRRLASRRRRILLRAIGMPHRHERVGVHGDQAFVFPGTASLVQPRREVAILNL